MRHAARWRWMDDRDTMTLRVHGGIHCDSDNGRREDEHEGRSHERK